MFICLAAAAPLAARADEGATPAATIVVSATRAPRTGLDVPAAVDVIELAHADAGQPRVNLSEALGGVPGIVVQNRENYAQDLQLSSRGFGARSAFGVRGVRLLTDGIPATTPDGQGQAATFDLDVAQRIEVLRGPFSAIYGNHAGGVVQLFTRDGSGPDAVETTISAGSDAARKIDVNAQARAGAVNLVGDLSRFETNGYRAHSAATREQDFAKVTTAAGGGQFTLVANGLRQHDTQDPLGVSWATWQRDPRAGEPDPSDRLGRSFAERYDTRKSIDHAQAGAVWDGAFEGVRAHVMLYGGNRQVVQYQSFSKAFQAAPTHSGGVVDFDRDFNGADGRIEAPFGATTLTVGIEWNRSVDARRGYENFVGDVVGVRGALRRDETDRVRSAEPYAQWELAQGPWRWYAGARRARLDVDVADHYLANGDDSGSLSYARTTGAAGAVYRLDAAHSVYASAARGMETPTLNELFYSPAGGFNFGLRPATSRQLEVGWKSAQAALALFTVRTHDELVVDTSSGGRSSYRNADSTARTGIEWSDNVAWSGTVRSRFSATLLRATFDNGHYLPGVPARTAYADLVWSQSGYTAGLEMNAAGRVYPDDANAAQPAPGYAVAHAFVRWAREFGHWRLGSCLRLNNVAGHAYIGSVIVGEANRRYYEPAPRRTWTLGFQLGRTFE
jgi:iron complex outermembrane receptor protein